MKHSFILLSCLLSVALVQAEPFAGGCCGGRKKKDRHEKLLVEDAHFNGCGCGGGGSEASDDIPPPENS
jgi:hypothetical protein